VDSRPDRLPTGTVTFLFSDIEGSTRLAQALGPAAWAALLREHDARVDRAVAPAGGVVVKHEGDGAFVAFARPEAAVEAATAISRSLAELPAAGGSPVRVRIGLHTGVGATTEDGADYVGIDVHYAARIAAAANGGQIVLSDVTTTAVMTAPDALPAGTRLENDGFHPLRDFEEPRLLHRLVVPGAADDERPLRSLRVPGNLPEPVTTFVGRDAELAAVASLLDTARLLTLTGPGGTGKTRLALALAGSVARRFPDGTWFVDLSPIRDPNLIPTAIASALGVHAVPDKPVLDALRDHLRERTLLLVLDNLEQLLPAAGVLVSDLVRTAPGLHVVVTSREILRVSGEQEYPVAPLPDGDAIDLFVQRARLVRPDLVLGPDTQSDVEAIVARLEGLPLAVELAAARVRIFTPARILERLGRSLDVLGDGARDLPERQRTLRGAIAWSVDLLTPDEQALFRRLAVFSGGWTADQAQEVASPDGSVDAFGGLESLADKSLVRIAPTDHGEPRFNRHAFIREYATELLESAKERELCERRHAMVFVAFAELTEPHLMASDSVAWLDLVEHERHNLRAAMRWSLTVGEPDIGLRIAASIWRFWHQNAELREGADWLTELLAHPDAQADSAARVRGLSARGGLAYWANDFQVAWASYDEALAIAERLGDPRLIADANYEVGFRYIVEHDGELLERYERRALELYESLGDEEAVLRARQALVVGSFIGGDPETARRLETENLAAFRRSGSWYRTADSLTLLSAIEVTARDYEAAAAHVREAFSIVGPRAMVAPIVGALGVAAHIALGQDEPETAARLAGAAAVFARRAEITNAGVEVLHMADPVAAVRERLGAAAEPLLADGGTLTIEEAVALASR
jgi:predicted ATPase/class 3 adenylate cyclase